MEYNLKIHHLITGIYIEGICKIPRGKWYIGASQQLLVASCFPKKLVFRLQLKNQLCAPLGSST